MSSVGRAGPDPHLPLVRPEPEAGHPLLDEEGRDRLRALRRIERGEDEIALGVRRIRDPDLGAAQPVGRRGVGRADPLRPSPDRRRIAAGVRLGQGKRAQRLAARHRRQPAALLLGRSPGDHRVLRQQVHRQRDGHRHVDGAELLHRQRPAEVGEPGATDRLGEWRRGQPELAHLGEERAVVALGLVALDRRRRQLARGEVARRGLQQQLLLGQPAAHRPARSARG